MRENLIQEVLTKNKEHKRKRIWYRIMTCMAALVVFCTTYALILPAITLDNNRTCGIENHEHDDIICYIDTEKDVETESTWRATLPLPLTGDYRTDLIAMAESQLNYSESLRNLIIDEEEGVLKGYTRYGAWAEDAYGDWNRYFVSFCLYYAGIDEDAFPQSEDYEEWIELLRMQGLYKTAEEYNPSEGDILFLDSDEDGVADRVAVVAERNHKNGSTLRIKVVEGDVGGTNNRFTKTEIPMTAGGTTLPNGTVGTDGTGVSGGDILNGETIVTSETTVPGENTVLAGEVLMSTVSDGNSMTTTMVQYHAPENYTGGKVQYVEYAAEDTRIVGYGVLPKQPLVYTFSDDNVKVVVKLPEDSSVPEDAVLKVTPIESEDENYDSLTEQAENVVEGAVMRILFYDISFYAADDEYIPVDERAQVTIRLTDTTLDTESDVAVLHYEEEGSEPILLEEVTVDEQAVIEFETQGFSTFAVVEYETDVYETEIVTPAKGATTGNYNYVTGLEDKTYVISTFSKEFSMSSENMVINDTDANTHAKLEAVDVVKSTDTTITNIASTDLLWKFEGTETAGVYYIQSVSTKQYLNIVDIRTLSTSEEKQAIEVVTNEENMIALRVQYDGNYYYVNKQGDAKESVFSTWRTGNGLNDQNNQLVLSLYEAEDEKPQISTGVPIGGSDVVVIASVNTTGDLEDGQILTTGEVENVSYSGGSSGLVGLAGVSVDEAIKLDENNNATAITLQSGDAGQYWLREDNDDNDPNTYFLRSVAEGTYLHLSAQGLTLAETPQVITQENGVPKNNGVVNIVCLSASDNNVTYYLNLYGNKTDSDFTVTKGENIDLSDGGNHMVVFDQGYALVPDLEGKSYMITSVNFSGNPQNSNVVTLTSTNADNVSLNGKGATATIVDNTVEMVTIQEAEGDTSDAAWLFESAEMLGTYYIRSAATGKYLNISAGTLTTSDMKQQIEAITADVNGRYVKNNVICLRTVGENPAYLQLFGNKQDSRAFVGSSKDTSVITDGGNHFVLTEYELPVTNLGDKVYFIVGVNDFKDNVARPPALASTGDAEGTFLTGENLTLAKPINEIVKDGGYEAVAVSVAADDNNNLGWFFKETDTPGTYRLMAANGVNRGQYMNIADGKLTVSDTPQDIEVVKGSGTTGKNDIQDVVCLRTKDKNGNYFYVYLQENNREKDFIGNAVDQSARATHLVLFEIPNVNSVVTQIEELLNNLVPVTDANGEVTGYEFSDEAKTGSATPGNGDENQKIGNASPTKTDFQEKYDLAKAYRTEMKEKAKAGKKAYENLPDEEKRYVVNYEELVKLEWLWSQIGVVESVPVNATVKLFNYKGNVNEEALAKAGYSFYHKNSYDSYTAIANDNRNNSGVLGCNGSPLYMSPSLVNEFPEVDIAKHLEEKDLTTTEDLSGSLGYLFGGKTTEDGKYDPKYYEVATDMKNGGGLFQYRDDGYYYYNSSLNSAHYDKDKNEFVLYDTLIRPMYIHGEEPGDSNNILDDNGNIIGNYNLYNFLPFNNPAESAVLDQESVDTINGLPTAYLNERTDVWFGMLIECDFIMPKDGKVLDPNGELQEMVFKFEGDDDVFVYIDGKLVMDLGGVHGARYGEINFAKGTVRDYYENKARTREFQNIDLNLKDNTKHTLQFYYIERGGNVSYNSIEFNITSLPEEYLMVGKAVDTADVGNADVIDGSKYYTFRVVQANEDGKLLDAEEKITTDAEKVVSYFEEGVIFDIWKDGAPTGETGVVGKDGYFSLPLGYTAMFSEVLDEAKRLNDNCSYYIVQEIIEADETGQYSGIIYNTQEVTNPEDEIGQFISLDSDSKLYTCFTGSAGNGEDSFEIRNKLLEPPGILEITKKVIDDGVVNQAGDFTIQVLIGDEKIVDTSETKQLVYTPLPKGTVYTKTNKEGEKVLSSTGTEEWTVDSDNGYITLQDGETITIPGFLAGTNFKVVEILEGQEYIPSYEWGTAEADKKTDVDGAEDVFGVNQTIEVTVINDDYDFSVEIPISKEIEYNSTGGTFTFLVEEYTMDKDGNFASKNPENPIMLYGETITMANPALTEDGKKKETAYITIGYDLMDTSAGKYYYKISEEKGTENYVYDTTYYIVEVTVTKDGTTGGEAKVTQVWKNGETPLYSDTNQPAEPIEALPFVNYRATTFTVTKTVNGRTTDTAFPFTAVVTALNGTTETFTFQLKDGESYTNNNVPYGSTVTITEGEVQDYFTATNVINKYEAENGTLTGGAAARPRTQASGGLAVGFLGFGDDGDTKENQEEQTGSCIIEAPYPGTVTMRVWYSDDANEREFDIWVNDTQLFTESFEGDHNNLQTFIYKDIENVVLGNDSEITFTNNQGRAPNLDYIELIYPVQDGNSVTLTISDETTINFYNTEFYELPESGGTGTTPYMIGGLLTILSALTTLLLYNKHYSNKHRKKVKNSS